MRSQSFSRYAGLFVEFAVVYINVYNQWHSSVVAVMLTSYIKVLVSRMSFTWVEMDFVESVSAVVLV